MRSSLIRIDWHAQKHFDQARPISLYHLYHTCVPKINAFSSQLNLFPLFRLIGWARSREKLMKKKSARDTNHLRTRKTAWARAGEAASQNIVCLMRFANKLSEQRKK